ncbi:hypothetical protein RND81_02G198100 [Saponaria officinalis]|uniref:CCHC-type domain-containing protein n=1 Tax=Saponaria officinalis TaxID=3572 RepID=A0AAW1MMX3_SAPOF
MAGNGNGNSRTNAQDLARIRRLEDAIIALANNANNQGNNHTIFDRFDRHRPPTYDGVADPVILESWLREMKKLFVATRCPEDQKVDSATYYLKKEADNWWAVSRLIHQAQPGFGWHLFTETLKKRFYPEELRWQKEREFLRLEQGTMSVQQYADNVPDEAARVRRFEKNLTPRVRTVLAGIPSTTFRQAYNRVLSVYESVKAEEAEEATRVKTAKRAHDFIPTRYQGGEKEVSTKRPRFEGLTLGKRFFEQRVQCPRCGKTAHVGKNCDGTAIVCYYCKTPGHKSNECPKKTRGEIGAASGTKSQAQNKGRIYVMNRREAEAHPDVVGGTFFRLLICEFILTIQTLGISFFKDETFLKGVRL